MASLSLKHIYKVYDGGVKAVNDFCMEIEDKEFIVFVGPSGCGKSTTLRMIAGLEDITAGELRIDDVIVNDYEPKDRNIAMVFQNYALYPHMSVYDNLAFSLKTSKIPAEEIHEKVVEAARILGITEYLDRKPKALSGGQRQRVALGRAIVRNPKVFLLDEPLSNLDAKLRAAMRAEISRLHEKLQTTFIYVTHDQVEAMTMGTRIVVMKAGYVQQIDTPQNLYKYPGNIFVAGFIGTPQMNFFDGTITKQGNNVKFDFECGSSISMDYSLANKILVKFMDGKHPVVVGVRPDDVKVDDGSLNENEWAKMKAVVSVVEALGGETLIYANLNTDDIDAAEGSITIKVPGDYPANRGEIIDIAINKNKLHVFDKESEKSIKLRVPEVNAVDAVVDGAKLSFASQSFELPKALSHIKGAKSELIIPTDALLLGDGQGKAKVEAVESIEGKQVYQLKVGELTMFAVEKGEARFSAGAEVAFGLDFSRVELTALDVKPLDTVNTLDGEFVKVKEVENGKKVYSFYMEIAGQRIASSKRISEKLFACKGTKIFKTPLEYVFGADAVAVSDSEINGICFRGTVSEILDYGEKKYARVDLGGGKLIIVKCEGEISGDVWVALNRDGVTVKDKNLDIIIV
ncbi:MAG: sn-glycerol-3-phosphate ABC transporter ATP-binding protein UgpC [Clostridia bacterium]|nr:sn-glycerol-3-phosphate ABC transporter ATP-binding protein UgpC [Clostridia bacterium]